MPLRMILTLLAAIVLPLRAGAVPPVAALPSVPRDLCISADGKWVAAAMALEGVAFFPLEPATGGPVPQINREMATLSALPAGGGDFFLAGRWGTIRRMKPNAQGAFTTVSQWDVEGIPTGLARHQDTLLVAAGPEGLLLYDLAAAANGTRPALRGRYPFVDYTKEISVASDGVIYLADNRDTGVQVLNVEEPLRPRSLFIGPTGGFVDSIAHHGGLLAVGNRHGGVFVLDASNARNPQMLARLDPMEQPAPGAPPHVYQVRFSPAGDLLVCEGDAGARLLAIDRGPDGKVTLRLRQRFPTGGKGAWCGAFLPDGTLLLARSDGSVVREAPL